MTLTRDAGSGRNVVGGAVEEGSVGAADGGGGDFPEHDVEVAAGVQADAGVAFHVGFGGDVEHGGYPGGGGLVGAAGVLAADGLAVDDLDLAAEFLGQEPPDLGRDRLGLEVLGHCPVVDGDRFGS